MDESNNLTGQHNGEMEQAPSVDSTVSSNGESNGTPPRTPGRTITSKRVVIPPGAKRVSKPAPAPEAVPVQEPAPIAPVVAAATVVSAADAPVLADQAPIAAETLTPEPLPVDQNPVFIESAAEAPPLSSPSFTPAAIPLAAAAATQVPTNDFELKPSPVRPETKPAASATEGVKMGGLPYSPSPVTYPTVIQKQPKSRRGLEVALWIVAALLLVSAVGLVLFFVFPDTISGIVSPQAGAPTQVAVSLPTSVAQPTTTVLPTGAPTLPASFPTTAPLVIPTPPVDGQQRSLVTDAALTGWYDSGEPAPHYGDENLHAGTFQGKNLSSVLQFNLRNLPQDTKILFAAIELTGRDGSRLGTSGGWQLDLVENSLATDWFQATSEQIASAKSLGEVGQELPASELGAGRLNRFILTDTERQMLEQQFQNGNAVFRLRGPASSEDNLFTWESGASGSALNAPTLHLVFVSGKYVIVTNTPVPENVLTAAAYVVRGTEQAKRRGTPTSFPPGVATGTPSQPTLVVPAETAIAGNQETAVVRAQLATAVARTTGTYTPTQPFVILYPTLTPVVIVPEDLATATAIPPDTDLATIPINYAECQCLNRILLLSTRYGGEQGSPIMIEPNGTAVGKLSGDLYYDLALSREQYSPDHTMKVDYLPKVGSEIQQLVIVNQLTNEVKFITNLNKGLAYDAAWAPDGSAIAYVATSVDNADQIYLYDFGTEESTLLVETPGGQPWFKHPTWSPDSKQLAYWSSVDATCDKCGQIWVINRDGTNARNISKNGFDERDPVWVK